MKNVAVRFLLQGGVYVDVIMLEQEARGIMDGFHKGTLREVIGEPFHQHGPWVVRTKDIQAIQMGQVQTAQQYQTIPTSTVGASGIK